MISDAELQPTGVPNQVKVVRIAQGARKQLVFQLLTREGDPVDLTQEVVTAPAQTPGYGPQRQVSPMAGYVRLRAKSELGCSPAFDLLGTWDPEVPNVVVFQLDETTSTEAGVFFAEIGQFVSGDHLVESWPCYVLVEPSLFSSLDGTGPLSIAEIRLGLLDFAPDEVSLLDDMEFSDLEIIHAIRHVIHLWNETPPDVQDYTTNNFPYRYHWILGTCAHLLDMAAAKYRRNYLSYSAGGVSIGDQDKAKEYQEMSREKKKEFQDWMMRTKMRLQMEVGWASF